MKISLLIIFFNLLLAVAFAQSSINSALFGGKIPFPDYPGNGSNETPSTKNVVHEPVIDSLYIVGPGDVLKITYFGNVLEEDISVAVDVEGNLVIPKMGVLKANKTLKEVKNEITALIKTRTKNVEIVIQLSGIKPVIIPVVGQVPHPGSYEFSSTVRLDEVLFKAFMTSKDSVFKYPIDVSLRNVVVYGADGSKKQYDFENYLLNGNISDNPYLFSGNRIVVQARTADVFITGAVVRPRNYCYAGQTLYDFIQFAGGLKASADSSSISVASYSSDGFHVETKRLRFPEECRSYLVRPEDYVVVGAVPYWQEQMQVTIIGRVKNPGTYLLNKGATLSELFEKSGGKLDDADIYIAYLSRTKYFDNYTPAAYRSGLSDFMQASANIPHINFEENLFKKDSGSKTVLLDGDYIFVPKVINYVSIVGSVCSPGLVDYKRGEDWEYYVDNAGGFDSKSYKKNAKIFKKDKGAWVMASSAESVEPGDIIMVPPLPDDYYWNRFKDFVTMASGLLSAGAILWTVSK